MPLREAIGHGSGADSWPIENLGEVVALFDDKARVDPDAEYRMAGVKWYAGGVFHRETVLGKDLSARYVTPLQPGALIYNRLFAWKESFAVVEQQHSSLFVSNEFPQFLPDTTRVFAEFLYLFCTTPTITRLVNAASAGSAAVSRNRFKEAEFLRFSLRLPPLPIQQAIVDHWKHAQERVAVAKGKADEHDQDVDGSFLEALGIRVRSAAERPRVLALSFSDLDRWAVSSVVDQVLHLDCPPDGKYPLVQLGELAGVSYGIQKSPSNRPGLCARPYLRVANVRKGFLDLSEIKEIEVSDRDLPTYLLKPGDILFVEGNGSRSELGRVAKWSGEIEDCVHQNHLIKVRPNQERLLPDFAMTWFNTEIGRSHFFRAAKSSSGLGTINSSEVRLAPIPLPPLDVQRKLVSEIIAACERIAGERAAAAKLAADTAREVEEMILGHRPVPGIKAKA